MAAPAIGPRGRYTGDCWQMRLGVEPSNAGIRQGGCDSDSERLRAGPLSKLSFPPVHHGQPGSAAFYRPAGSWPLGTPAFLALCALPFQLHGLRTNVWPIAGHHDMQRPAGWRLRGQIEQEARAPASRREVHQHLLTKRGIRTQENSNASNTRAKVSKENVTHTSPRHQEVGA
jgi:hypothetical protein